MIIELFLENHRQNAAVYYNTGKNEEKWGLIVFTPGVVAFGAAEESDFGFISTSELPEPPFGDIVSAVRAGNLDGRFGSEVFIAVDDQDIVCLHIGYFFHLIFCILGKFLNVVAFGADEFTVFCLQQLSALRTEHHIINVCIRKIYILTLYPMEWANTHILSPHIND